MLLNLIFVALDILLIILCVLHLILTLSKLGEIFHPEGFEKHTVAP